jgi:hypothetical protein
MAPGPRRSRPGIGLPAPALFGTIRAFSSTTIKPPRSRHPFASGASAAMRSIPGGTAMRSGTCRGIDGPSPDATPAVAGDGEMLGRP